MADDVVSYVITIKTENADSGSSSENNSGVAKTKDGQDATGIEKKPGSAAHKIGLAFAAVRKIANTVIPTAINRVDIRTGNTTLAQKLSYQYSVANRGVSIAASLVFGVATKHPVIGFIGSAVSAASWGADIALSKEELSLQRRLEDISIQQANIRAGAGGGRAGRNGY